MLGNEQLLLHIVNDLVLTRHETVQNVHVIHRLEKLKSILIRLIMIIVFSHTLFIPDFHDL